MGLLSSFPVPLLKAHSHAVQPLRDSLERGGTFVSLVLSLRVYFYSVYSVGISPWFVCWLHVTSPWFSIVCLSCESVTDEEPNMFGFLFFWNMQTFHADSCALFAALYQIAIKPWLQIWYSFDLIFVETLNQAVRLTPEQATSHELFLFLFFHVRGWN